MSKQLERVLAFHCAPALAGIKSANLVCLPKANYPALEEELALYNAAFLTQQVRFEILCQCRGRAMVLIYRPALLTAALSHPLATCLLSQAGYPIQASLADLLAELSRRLQSRAGVFPHEIGLFLGYPPEDVRDFQRYHGKGCKLCGHWKVYHDPESARQRFQRYDQCRDALCSRLSQGITLIRMFCAA